MPGKLKKQPKKFSTLNEKSLHADLKRWYAQPDDRFEVSLDGFVIDIVHGDLLIEIQTRNFSALKKKLTTLVNNYPVRLVYPVEREKWIIKLPQDAHSKAQRRKSPKRGAVEHVFQELVYIPKLLAHPNFSLDVLLIQAEEDRRYDGKRGWRRNGWVTHERRLLAVVNQVHFETPADLGKLIPKTLEQPFTTGELAVAIAKPHRLAQKMAYCLRELHVIHPEGKRGNAILYTRTKR